ncbi:hypothetical protein HKD37_12G033812 [Glycine soja]
MIRIKSINLQFAIIWACNYLIIIFPITPVKKLAYPIAQRLFAMRRYGGGILYAVLSLHMQRGCFRIRTHDQQVTKAQF